MGLFSNYCGLGDSKGKGTQHETDKLCKEHDDAYEEMIKEGKNPYFSMNKADQMFLKKLKALKKSGTVKETVLKEVAKKFVEFKQVFLNKDGDVIPQKAAKGTSKMSNKRFRDEPETPRKSQKQSAAIIPYNDEKEDYGVEDDGVTPMGASMARSGGGNGRRTAGQETPILRAPRVAHPGFQNTATVSVGNTFEYICRMQNKRGATADWKLRPTSIHDPMKGVTTLNYANAENEFLSFEDATGEQLPLSYVSQGGDPRINQPHWAWKPYYRALYEKYVVLGCKYEITLSTDNEDVGNDFLVWSHLRGEKDRPSLSLADVLDNSGWVVKRLVTNRNAQPRGQNNVRLSGYYRSGDFGEDVVTDAMAETWTNFDDHPTYDEFVEWGIEHATDATINQTQDYTDINIHVKLSYTVQFKGLKNKWKYYQRGQSQWPNDPLWEREMYGRYP